MQLHRPFRFGVVTHNTNTSLDALVARARLAERLGYSTFLIPDHLGDQFDTPLALALVAQATRTLRLGSFVFANDFRHPALLAKIAATLDVISGGRFELGLGAGWMQSEYEQVGIAFDTPSVAAREADIVSILPRGMLELEGLQRIDLADAGSTSVARKVAWIREAAAERFQDLELNLFILDMALTDRQGDGADRLALRFALSREQVMDIPHLLAGTVDQIGQQLREAREQYGISYLVVFDEHMEQFAPIVAHLANQ